MRRGNQGNPPTDYRYVGCELFREALSARLDGEEEPLPSAEVDRHLAGCAGCRAWADAAAEVTRLARTAAVPSPKPAPDVVVAAAPGRGRARVAIGLRVALAAVGVAQFLLGAAQIAGLGQDAHVHPAGTGFGADHLWNESAAWNLAIGAGFAFVALRRTRPSGLLPTLTAFVAVLMLLSAGDILAGDVGGGRLASHAFLIAGYLITVALSLRTFDPGEPPARKDGPSRWRATFGHETASAPPPRLRVIPGGRAVERARSTWSEAA